MICRACRGPMTEKKITVDLRVNDNLLIVEEVPAKVCEHCGERVFTPAVTKKLQDLAKRRKKPPRTQRVPVFNLEKGAL
jgi:YgiT-type zinc finger domain-containing protein